MRDNRPSGSEGGVESHISIPTPIYKTAEKKGPTLLIAPLPPTTEDLPELPSIFRRAAAKGEAVLRIDLTGLLGGTRDNVWGLFGSDSLGWVRNSSDHHTRQPTAPTDFTFC